MDSMPQFVLQEDLKAAVAAYLEQVRAYVAEQMDLGTPSERLVHQQSRLMDELIQALYGRAVEIVSATCSRPLGLAVFALGGYGRAELNLYSDIDLLFVSEEKNREVLENFTQKMLYPLWDAQVQLGYAVRSVEDCERVVQQDSRAMSAMLDARFLGGDANLARKFSEFMETKTSSSKALKKFIEDKGRENRDRGERFGNSVYVIEPNLKESEGGLRDWHTLWYFVRWALKTAKLEDWVRQGFFSAEERDRLERSLRFLWEVRNRLHRLAGRCQDQLSFEYQKPIAAEMGYEDGVGVLGVERFMQDYYLHASNLYRLRLEATRRLGKKKRSWLKRLKDNFRTSLSEHLVVGEGKISPKDYAAIEEHPVEILRAFYFAQREGWLLEEEFQSWIGQHLHLIDSQYRQDPEVCRLLREMFSDAHGIGDSLWRMYECRFLGVLIPEFGDILFQTQHDVYHVYTVDTHSIFAVQEISKLCNGHYDQEFPEFKKALDETTSPGVLVLGVLFHDIGKGKGGSHSEIGAELAQRIMTRMGYAQRERDVVEFLVLSHLIMPHLSQRRDLQDAKLISQFARTMENLERLNLLFLLTWADIRAVGPEVWTPWKGALLKDLYEKTRQVLETGEFNPERAVVMMRQAKEAILASAPADCDVAALTRFLDSMRPRYFLAQSGAAILHHFSLVQRGREAGFVFAERADVPGGCNEILIHTLNSPRLFEQVTGVLAANQVNILAFDQFFSSQGEVLLLLKVTDQRGELLEERRFVNLEKDLREVVQGKVQLQNYYRAQSSSPFSTRKNHSVRKEPSVEVDNDVSPYYTIIDIFANDRVGLLYDLAKVMRKLNLFIEVSKISTKVDQVADVFYVKDIFGDKITDRKKIAAIKAEILRVFAQAKEAEA